MPLDPSRTVAELRELQQLTGDENGAQRVAWTETWERAREWLRGKVAETGAEERLDSWADEEGARFGRSLFGSSAAAGSMADQDELRQRHDNDGVALPDALREHGVDLDRALEARSQLANAAAYLELHIEQGPVLESLDLPLGVVLGNFGVERHQITWKGQAAHAGSTPMDRRRDALAGAAKLALEIRKIAG